MSAKPPFQLDLWSLGGAPLGAIDSSEGEAQPIHEWTTHLRIRSDVVGFVSPSVSDDEEFTGFVPPAFEDDGIAVLVHLRDQQDLGGATVGLHHARLDVPALDELRAAVEATAWTKLPRPRGGDFNLQHFTLRYGSGTTLIERAFNAGNSDFIAALGPLWRLIEGTVTRCMRSPTGTLTPSVEHVVDEHDASACKFRVTLRNAGIGPIAITDPRVPSHAAQPRFAVQVGECIAERDDLAPFDWTDLALPQLPEGAPRARMLVSRQRIQYELPWRAPKPGNYEVRMRWYDYEGPIEPVPGVIPFMPVPRKGRAFIGAGPYLVRGTCSARLRFTVPDPTSG
jgi:hypothetical protein